jgi:molybdopterin converting factor small subunit
VSVVRLPPILRPEVGGLREVEIAASTVAEALAGLVGTYPALRDRVFDDGQVPPFINVFVDGDDVRILDGLDTEVGPGTTILLLPAVAGGNI